MKRISMIGLLLLVLLSGGCNTKYSVKTRIHPDGSFEKTIVCEGDSLGIYELSLPFDLSDGWNMEIRRKTDGSDGFITTATKRYPSLEDLQKEYARGLDSSKLRIVSSIEKRFRWFFTYYTYEETIPAFGLFTQTVPIGSVFTPAELEALAAGKDSVLNKRFDEYWMRTVVDGFIDDIIVRSRGLDAPVITPRQWLDNRTGIADSILRNELSTAGEASELIERTFRVPPSQGLRGAIDTAFTVVMAKEQLEQELDIAYRNDVVMPGMLITSNAGTVEGSTLSWDCRPHRCIDVVMRAESRTINLWAFYTTGGICLALLAVLFVPMLRRH